MGLMMGRQVVVVSQSLICCTSTFATPRLSIKSIGGTESAVRISAILNTTLNTIPIRRHYTNVRKFCFPETRSSLLARRCYATSTQPPIIRIQNGTSYRHHPNSTIADSTPNPALFPNLNFNLPSFPKIKEHWAIVGPSSSGKTTLLQLLSGKHLCIPADARTYPYLESDEIEHKNHELRIPSRAIKRVGFDGEQGLGTQAPKGAYLSARYESRKEIDDFSVLDYLRGNTELNPFEDGTKKIDIAGLDRVITDLRLEGLIDMPVSNLSNGQTRRARIARALLEEPEVLLLDEPFMGLDPPTLLSLSPMLRRLADANAPRLVLAFRPQDPIPDWITHLMYLKGTCEVAFQGRKQDVLAELQRYADDVKKGRTKPDVTMHLQSIHEIGRSLTEEGIVNELDAKVETTKEDSVSLELDSSSTGQELDVHKEQVTRFSRDGYEFHDKKVPEIGKPLVEMEGAVITYGTKTVLGNWTQNVDGEPRKGLWWQVKRGERWGIFGPNGSGKTTILSLICSDHPQTYSLPVRLFGRSRLPQKGERGISIFDIQSRIGHSSPEIHNHIPRSLTLRQVLENAWSDTFKGVPKLDESANERIDACLRWFEQDLRLGTGLPRTEERQLGSRLGVRPEWANDLLFGGLPFGAQRVALFLRAIVKQPDLIILDEAFSGMDDLVRDRCLVFLGHGETKQIQNYSTTPSIVKSDISRSGLVKVSGLSNRQALICISHVKEEIPGSIREWICLPEAHTGKPARFGRLDGPIEGDYERWNEIWDI